MFISYFLHKLFDFCRENDGGKQRGMKSTQPRETVFNKKDDVRIEMASLLSSDVEVPPNDIRNEDDDAAIVPSETIGCNQSGKNFLCLSYYYVL